MILLIEKETKKAIVFKVKADLCRKIDISPSTLWLWSKNKIHETPTHIVFFDCEMFRNKTLIRNNAF